VFPPGVVAGGRVVPRGLRVGETGACHPEGRVDLVAHVLLAAQAGDREDHLPKH
jgi:hypothetical protein